MYTEGKASCILCKGVAHEMKELLSKNKTVDFLQKNIKKVACAHDKPAVLKTICTKITEMGIPALIDMITNKSSGDICRLLTICPKKS